MPARALDAVWDALRALGRAVLRLRVATVLLAVVVVAAGVAVATALRGDGPGLRDGSEVVAERGRPVPDRRARRPVSYRMVVRVESRAAGDLVVRTEERWVRRPFDGRVEEEGRVTTTRFGRLAVDQETAEATALFVVPNPPVADRQPLPALNTMVEAGTAEVGERRRLEALGVECQVYRTGGPAARGPIPPLGTEAGERADLCVDERGLVLEEAHFVDGDRLLTRSLAVEVEERPRRAPGLFDLPGAEPPPVDEGGGSVRRMAAGERPPGTFWEVPSPPPGFAHRGRYAVVPPQPQAFADPAQAGSRLAGVVDVWVDGPDFVALDQGGTLGGARPFPPQPHARPVDLGPLGRGELLLGARTSEVRVVDGGRYVRVYGTVSPGVLTGLARSLEGASGA